MYVSIADLVRRTSMIRIGKLTIASVVVLYLSSAKLSSACARVMNELTCRAGYRSSNCLMKKIIQRNRLTMAGTALQEYDCSLGTGHWMAGSVHLRPIQGHASSG